MRLSSAPYVLKNALRCLPHNKLVREIGTQLHDLLLKSFRTENA